MWSIGCTAAIISKNVRISGKHAFCLFSQLTDLLDSCTGTLSFYCPSSRQCVSTFMVCDGNLDCLNGEDEGEPAGCRMY